MPLLEEVSIPLESTDFFNQIVRELTGALQDIVGLNEAEGFIALVANRIGDTINRDYRNALSLDTIPKEMLSDVLTDLKRRIGGKFTVEYEDHSVLILRNSTCPFGDKVKGRPSLCMMTANVFGRLAADSAGYARVTIDRALAKGDSDCRVIIHLAQSSEPDDRGREFYKVRQGA
ncbi:methanogen output domain 1-containing protein [Roseibium sp. M-1]